MRKPFAVSALLILLLISTACGKNSFSPAEINEAVHTCEICNMQVANDRHATQIVTKEGRSLMFDDLGCLHEWKEQNGNDTIGEQYVRDYHTLEWIKLADASYVYDESFSTPMAYGIYSFKDKSEAEQFIAEQNKGQLMTASDLDSHTWESHHGDHHGGGHGDDHGDHHDDEESSNGHGESSESGH